jgi:hypothetical protein
MSQHIVLLKLPTLSDNGQIGQLWAYLSINLIPKNLITTYLAKNIYDINQETLTNRI